MSFDYAGYFGEITTLHDLTVRPEERTWKLTGPGLDPEPHQVILYLGCNVLRTSHMIRTVTAIFDRLGVDYIALGGPTYCCGIVHNREGDTSAATGMSHATVEMFRRMKPEEVVMWCPSCIHFYDDILAMPLPFRVRHPSQFLVDQLPRLTFTARVDAAVALHAHVVGGARRREGAAARALLEAVPGLRIVDLDADARFDYTCAPFVPQQIGLDRWNALVRGMLAQAHAHSADTLATMYHGCQRMMCAFEAEQPVRIEHYLSVLGRALGIEFEDTFKKYRLWQDPERVLADATPCMEANGVDPAKARAVVTRIFPAA